MSKKCPDCLETYDDNHAFCSNCGSRLIDDLDQINIGDANAISGGININRSKNITSNDTHYHSTTILERSKSHTELKIEASNQLRQKVEEIFADRGRIDSFAIEQLRPIATQLGIDGETFKSIIKDVRSNKSGCSNGLSTANLRYMQQAKQAIQTNDFDSLSGLLVRLEALAAISQDEDVQYLYYMTLSLIDPLKSIGIYEQMVDENYWRSLWAIVSYIITGNYTAATRELTSFVPSRFNKSAEDQTLMEAFFNLIKNDRDAAQDFLNDIIDEPSPQLVSFHRALEASIYNEVTDNLEVRFYLEHIKGIKPAPLDKKKVENTKKTKEQSQISTNLSERLDGVEVEKLYTSAIAAEGSKRVDLLQKAADAGLPDAMYELALSYRDGKGTKKDAKLGIEWLRKSADAGFTEALHYLGEIYHYGFFGNREINQDWILAEQYYQKAKDKGFNDAISDLSMLHCDFGIKYYEGNGIVANHKKALNYFEKAIKESNCNTSMLYAAKICADTTSNAYDPQKAYKYSSTIVNKNLDDPNGVARYCLGLCYAKGLGGCYKNREEATKLMIKAVERGNERAQEWLKDEVEKGNQKAIEWVKSNVNYNISEPQAEMIASFSNMRIINTINKVNVRGKLVIHFAMGKTFDVTIQWNFRDFDRWFEGPELHIDTITPLYEFTEWQDFNFGSFGYDDIAPHNSPAKVMEGECIIRVHEQTSKEIIDEVIITCTVGFKNPLFGTCSVNCSHYEIPTIARMRPIS